ncbi:MAG: hypothetical protein KGL53_00465, partial [Elusimicrobia bacterium]|nr:hypothetical protein [Elusimicrobiota bacterium]
MPRHRHGPARRALRFLARALAGVFIILVLSVVGLSVWVQRTLTPERLRPLIVAQLQRTFDRRVEVEDVGVALHQGVRVTGLKVFARAGAPDAVMLAADAMVVKYSLPALLHGRLVLDVVRLENPQVTLYRRADGKWNFHELFGHHVAQEAAPRLVLPPLSAARRIRLESGTLHVVDALHRLDMHVHGIDVSIDDFSFTAPFPWSLKLVDDATFLGRKHHVELSGAGTFRLDAVADARTALEMPSLKASVDGRRFGLSGTVRNFLLPDFEGSLSLPAFTTDELAQWGPRVPPGLSLPESRWDVSVRTEPVSDSSPTPKAFLIDRLDGSGGPWTVQGSGRLSAADLALSGTLRTRGAPLSKAASLHPEWSANALDGTLDAVLTLGGTLPHPRVTHWDLGVHGLAMTFWRGKRFSDTDLTVSAGEKFKESSIRVTKGTYIAYSNALTDLDADVRFSSPDLAVPHLGLTWNGSHFGFKGCIRNLHTWRKVAVDAEVDKLRVDETYRAVENLIAQRLAELGKKPEKDVPWAQAFRFSIPQRFPDMIGRLRVSDINSRNFDAQNLNVVWSLSDIARGLKTVAGHFQAGFGPGSMR